MAKSGRVKARAILIASLLEAKESTHSTQRAVAALADVKPVTVRRWLDGETPIDVEALLCCPVLGSPFRDALCRFDHSHQSAPYLLKKANRKAGK